MSAEDPNDPTAEPTPANDLSHEPDSSDAPTPAARPAEAAADLSEEPAAAADSTDPDVADLPESPGAPEVASSSADDAAETDPGDPAETPSDAADASDQDAEPVGSDEAPPEEPTARETLVDADNAADESDAGAEPSGSEAPTDVDPASDDDASTVADPTASEAPTDIDPASADADAPTVTELSGSEPLADAANSADDPDLGALEAPANESDATSTPAPADALDDDDASGVLDPEDPLVAMLAELDAPRRPAPAGVQLSEELPIDPEDDLRGVEGEASLRLVSILESLLFAAARPLKVQDLRRILAETSKHQIQLALAHLMAITRDRGVVLAQVAGGFQFRTHPENAVWVQKMLQSKPARLSRTQIETLAIVAYRQPITRPEIDDVRGVDSGAVLKGLLERELVQIVGRKEEPGRPLLYGTTVKFLEFFNLRGLRDLPTLRDFRDLSEESKATLRTQLGASEAEALGQGVLGFPPAAAEETEDMQQPTFDEMPSGPDFTGSSESDFSAGGSSETVGEVDPPEQEPTPMELPGDPAPDELVPPAPERLPQPGPDEIRPPDPGTDSPDRPDEWHAPGPDIADVPGVDPGPGEPSEV